jgi:hypothetical protein
MWRVCLSLCQGRVELQTFNALALNVQLDVGDNIGRVWTTLVLHAPARRDSRAQQLLQLGCTLALPSFSFLALHPAHRCRCSCVFYLLSRSNIFDPLESLSANVCRLSMPVSVR